MELNQILERLDYTISKAKELKIGPFEEERNGDPFDFVLLNIVPQCLQQFYPEWEIEGFYFEESVHNRVLSKNYDTVYEHLVSYHGLSQSLIEILFYCRPFSVIQFKRVFDYNKLSGFDLQSNIYKMEVIRILLASGKITPNQEFPI